MKIAAWLSHSLSRQFPLGPIGSNQSLQLLAARGERVSFQVSLRMKGASSAAVSVEVAAPEGVVVRVRRVGCVPMPHHNLPTPIDELDGVGLIPGYVPDPLFPEATAKLAHGVTTSFWITLDVSRNTTPGVKNVRVTVRLPDKSVIGLDVALRVAGVMIQKRRSFPVTHWFYADAIIDWYKVEPFGDAFWPIVEKYMRNYADHGSDTIYVPVFTPPLDGVKRPTQLLGIKRLGQDRYEFDWSKVKLWIDTARRSGINRFEWTHLFTQWGAKHAIRIYEGRGENVKLLWKPETGATSPTYRKFLAQYLPQLRHFVEMEKLGDRSMFHVSDEPHGDEPLANYRRARALLEELAPWMQVMDALSQISFGREGLTDMPIPSIETTSDFRAEKIASWTYFCCWPRERYLNRLLDTPLAKIRMSGWLFYRLGAHGFLHWGYNYWYKTQTRQLIDPFTVTDGGSHPGWAFGDPMVVYPGPAEVGPIDSLRWEVFAESLQDYALLQTLSVNPNGPLLAPVREYNDFPKQANWLLGARKSLLLGT